MTSGWSLPVGSLGRWPDDYERGRPGWPSEVVDIPGLPSTATVLELGAGTGKLTRLLVSAFGRVAAVEPAEAMRRLLATRCPEADAFDGSAEEIPLVLTWNLPAGPTDPSIAAAERFLQQRAPDRAELGYDPLDLNAVRYESGEWRLPFAESPFEELQETRLANPQTVDRDGLAAFFASMGWIADLPDADRLRLVDEVRSHLTAAEYQRPWETHVHWTRLAAAPGIPSADAERCA